MLFWVLFWVLLWVFVVFWFSGSYGCSTSITTNHVGRLLHVISVICSSLSLINHETTSPKFPLFSESTYSSLAVWLFHDCKILSSSEFNSSSRDKSSIFHQSSIYPLVSVVSSMYSVLESSSHSLFLFISKFDLVLVVSPFMTILDFFSRWNRLEIVVGIVFTLSTNLFVASGFTKRKIKNTMIKRMRIIKTLLRNLNIFVNLQYKLVVLYFYLYFHILYTIRNKKQVFEK